MSMGVGVLLTVNELRGVWRVVLFVVYGVWCACCLCFLNCIEGKLL